MGLFRSKYSRLTDEELLQLFKDGQEKKVLEVFYVRYAHLIMGTALKFTNQISDAEDIVMQVFENLPNKIRKHEISNFKPWLHMVTKNQCLMELRKKKIEVPLELTERAQEEEYYDNSIDTQIALALDAIELLKEPQKSCIRLFFLEKLSYVEISGKLALDLKTVKSAIQNGKRNIKLQLIHRDEFK